jgi:hypothetical protein
MTSHVLKPSRESRSNPPSRGSLSGARGRRWPAFCLGGLLAAFILVGSACGASSTSHSAPARASVTLVQRSPPTPTTHAELTTFVGSAGTALGSFQRDVYKPYRQGRLKDPARDGAALRAARTAAALSADEVAMAKRTAASSTTLRKLYGPLAALELTLSQLTTGLAHGRASGGTIKLADAEVASLRRIATAARVAIPVPAVAHAL